jgi:pilus assembly protein CpaF
MFGKKPSEFAHAAPNPIAEQATSLPLSSDFVQGAVPPGSISNSVVSTPAATASPTLPASEPLANYRDSKLETPDYREAKTQLISELLDQLDFQALETLPPEVKRRKVMESCDRVLPRISIPLTDAQIALIKSQALDEILGFGPIEVLLHDPDVNDIMINTAKRVFIERAGKILRTDIQFNDEQHLIGVVQRIVSRVGRRIDEANPMVDARMPDGSRFNAIIPPLALDGALVSIRKFKKHKMPLTDYVKYESMTPAMVRFLEIAGAIRLNIIISGGTGSGKTTLLNALSGHIDQGERVITIEDAAELQLHQPHVLRLETRPSSTEGKGEVNQRMLVKNALRMRPDRIILGEMRGDEVIDVLSAMNTGHDGSMATIHANSPKDCLTRIENLVAMSSVNVGAQSLRYQIASAVQLIVQIQRMRDGKRRITQIDEITGLDGNTILSNTLFSFQVKGLRPDGTLAGEFVSQNSPISLRSRAQYFGLEADLLACFA